MTDPQNAFLRSYFEAHTPSREPASWLFREVRAEFVRLNIKSDAGLLKAYESFTEDGKFVALCIFAAHRYRPAGGVLFRELQCDNAKLSGAASGAIASIGEERSLLRVIRALRVETRRAAQLNMLSALCNWRAGSGDSRISEVLARVVMNAAEMDEARAMAAEGLANCLYRCDRRTKVFRDVVRTLMQLLDHPCASLRCCAVYALGELRVKQALSQLREVAANDGAMCPGIGSIREEALDAIRHIDG